MPIPNFPQTARAMDMEPSQKFAMEPATAPGVPSGQPNLLASMMQEMVSMDNLQILNRLLSTALLNPMEELATTRTRAVMPKLQLLVMLTRIWMVDVQV
jgi:hypothetical protein